MSPRKGNNTSPFEIMGNLSSSRDVRDVSGKMRPSMRAGEGPEDANGNAALGLWPARSGDPVVLRIPRGMLVIALVVAVALLILAYFVGYSVGDSGSVAPAQTSLAVDGSASGFNTADLQIPDGLDSKAGDSNSSYNTANKSGKSSGDSGSGSPRPGAVSLQSGLNYLVLATYPKDWAIRLKKFMASQGQPTVLNSIGGNKYQVIAAKYGFTGSQLDSRLRREFEKQMHDLGRAWKKFNDGNGDALGTMYFAKYSGK